MHLPDLLPSSFSSVLQVIVIDLAMSGDNAVIIGLAASGLPRHQRTKAIFIGILAATLLRIVFAAGAVQLLRIVGLLLAGGVLLLWVCWKMWRELRKHEEQGKTAAKKATKTLAAAAWQIVVADISMSLENVLAVAGAARGHTAALIFGLGLSVVMMGAAAGLLARLLERHRWIAYVGLLIVLYAATGMVYRGALELL